MCRWWGREDRDPRIDEVLGDQESDEEDVY